MNIKTEYHGWDNWTAIDEDTYDYDGPVGYGKSEAEAIADLKEQLEDVDVKS